LLAGDPHLHLTLPAIWFQLTQDSPGFHTAGVSIPGTPGVLIGHNLHIAWSLTDAQNQQTFFYMEKEDSTHPGKYFWNGAWKEYNPPGGVIWSANQRQVTDEYPYYIGTASNFFDPGYRANEIHRVLSQPGKLSAGDMQSLQTDTRDFLAAEMVPALLRSLSVE